MNNIYVLTFLVLSLYSCGTTERKTKETAVVPAHPESMSSIIDSLMFYRKNIRQTDLLSRHRPGLKLEEAYAIQKMILEEELKNGATLAGYKMGGTVTQDSLAFNPMFGFILDKNIIAPDSVVSLKKFPGGNTMVEGEVGFILNKDFPEGAESLEELKSGIEHIIGGVEFAKPLAKAPQNNDSAFSTNHVIATGLGQAGTIKGNTTASVEGFDYENETVKCYINDSLVAEGSAGKVYGTPINALYWLANELPKHGLSLKSGQVVITGGLYQNPTIDAPAEVRLEFSTLGTIRFQAK